MKVNGSIDRRASRRTRAEFASGADGCQAGPDHRVLPVGQPKDPTPKTHRGGLQKLANLTLGLNRAPGLTAKAMLMVFLVVAGSLLLIACGEEESAVPATAVPVSGGTADSAPEPAAGEMFSGRELEIVEVERILEDRIGQVEVLTESVVEVSRPASAPRSSSFQQAPSSPGRLITPTLGQTVRFQPRQPGATNFGDAGRQRLIDASQDGISTFSLDTDRSSFQLALNWANSGFEIDPASVRAEEWVNAFDYGYAAPSADDRFAVTSDLFTHPLNTTSHMARISFQAPEKITNDRLNVTLVLDASGSMDTGGRVNIARAAAEAILGSLDSDDRVSVVHFSSQVLSRYTVSNASPGDRAVSDSINALYPHESTNVQAGLNLGVRLADEMRERRPDALNYIVLMSDGVANVDATDPFAILEATSVPSGSNPLRLITVGVGIENYNDELLEQLAQHGNGWYRYLFSAEQARSTFHPSNWLALTSPVADQTRAQVVWNPEAVRAWRIVGYENRVTSDESFTQDRQEFAEIYAGSATTVFYELELHNDFRPQDGLGEVELRWVEPGGERSYSQINDIVSNGRVVRLADDVMLNFGAVVALTADRYSGLGFYRESDNGYARDLHALWEHTSELERDLGDLAAYRDFALVANTLRSAPHVPAPLDDSGYSR